jgi:hypothetical protein
MNILDILTGRTAKVDEGLWDAGIVDDSLVSYEDDVEPDPDWDEDATEEHD